MTSHEGGGECVCGAIMYTYAVVGVQRGFSKGAVAALAGVGMSNVHMGGCRLLGHHAPHIWPVRLPNEHDHHDGHDQ